jgi:hypothetical protein
MPAYRTFGATIATLVYLLALAYIAGTLKLDATTTNGLALAGTGAVSALAAKSAVQHWAKRPTPKPGPMIQAVSFEPGSEPTPPS